MAEEWVEWTEEAERFMSVPPLLEEIGKQGWIPVEKQLPPNRDTILVWDGKTVIFGRYERFELESGFCYAGGGKIFKPTLWKPIEPPEITSSSPSSASAPSGEIDRQHLRQSFGSILSWLDVIYVMFDSLAEGRQNPAGLNWSEFRATTADELRKAREVLQRTKF